MLNYLSDCQLFKARWQDGAILRDQEKGRILTFHSNQHILYPVSANYRFYYSLIHKYLNNVIEEKKDLRSSDRRKKYLHTHTYMHTLLFVLGSECYCILSPLKWCLLKQHVECILQLNYKNTSTSLPEVPKSILQIPHPPRFGRELRNRSQCAELKITLSC